MKLIPEWQLLKKSAECVNGVVRDGPVHRWARATRMRWPCAASIAPSASSTPAEGLRRARAAALQHPACPLDAGARRNRQVRASTHTLRAATRQVAERADTPRASERSPVKFGQRCAPSCTLPWRPRDFERPASGRGMCAAVVVRRVRPQKMSGTFLACLRVGQVWVSARSDAPCACTCARDRGNARFEHVFRCCGCHRAAAGLKSSSKDGSAGALYCCRAEHWQLRTCVGCKAFAL